MLFFLLQIRINTCLVNDCSAAGKKLKSKIGVHSFPTLLFGLLHNSSLTWQQYHEYVGSIVGLLALFYPFFSITKKRQLRKKV
jgi:hypothetical protein